MVALAGCTLTAGCTAEPSCEDLCGTAIIVSNSGADAIVPLIATTSNGIALGDQLFLKLAEVGPDLVTRRDSGFIPELAQSWTFVDDRTIEFRLNPGARWHDGQPVTSRDVAFTFELYRDTLVNAAARETLGAIQAVTPGDDHTVTFTFRRAYPEQFYDATHHMRIVPAHLLDTIPRGSLRSHPWMRSPIGNGPYRFVRWIPGQAIELAADPAFFLGAPGIGRLLLQVVPDQTAALEQLLAGDADILDFLGPPENVKRAEAAEHVRVYFFPSSFYYYIAFNFRDPANPHRPHRLFADASIRRAITMAVDREAVAQAVLGEGAVVPPGPISQALWIWDDGIPTIPYDTAEARRLLVARGWRDRDGDGVLDRNGTDLTFDLITPPSLARRRAAVIVQEQLRRMGIRLEITELEFQTWFNRSVSGRFDATIGAWGQDPSPAGLLETWSSRGPSNHGRYTDPEFDRLLEEALAAEDMHQSRSRWNRAMALINQDAPAIWMMTPMQGAGVHARFDNVVLRPDQWSAFLWTWRIRPDQMIARDSIGAS